MEVTQLVFSTAVARGPRHVLSISRTPSCLIPQHELYSRAELRPMRGEKQLNCGTVTGAVRTRPTSYAK